MHTALPDYTALQDTLDPLETDTPPAEVHGTLCGLLCASPALLHHDWQQRLWPGQDINNLLARESLATLGELLQTTRRQLNDPDCDFQLLLPDDETTLDARIYALSAWCQGFLAGLALGGVSDLAALPDDAREIAHDLLEIARAETSYHLEGSEADEEAYAELMEYLRVGVLLIHEELQPVSPANPHDDNPDTARLPH